MFTGWNTTDVVPTSTRSIYFAPRSDKEHGFHVFHGIQPKYPIIARFHIFHLITNKYKYHKKTPIITRPPMGRGQLYPEECTLTVWHKTEMGPTTSFTKFRVRVYCSRRSPPPPLHSSALPPPTLFSKDGCRRVCFFTRTKDVSGKKTVKIAFSTDYRVWSETSIAKNCVLIGGIFVGPSGAPIRKE